MHSPHMVVQHTRNGTWMILYQVTFDLNGQGLQLLGKAIENHLARPA